MADIKLHPGYALALKMQKDVVTKEINQFANSKQAELMNWIKSNIIQIEYKDIADDPKLQIVIDDESPDVILRTSDPDPTPVAPIEVTAPVETESEAAI
jgi:hypothetical protein